MATSARSFVINIDFGTGDVYTGTAVAPDAGTFWNAVGPTLTTDGPLLDSMGNPTPITITPSGGSARAETTSVLNPSHVDPAVPVGSAGAFDALTRDAIENAGFGDTSFTLNNVPPGEYELFVYEVRGNATDDTGFSVNSSIQSLSPDNDATIGFVFLEDYYRFRPHHPDAQGQLLIAFFPAFGGSPGAINGLQLRLIPEPGTAVLLALGLTGLFGIRPSLRPPPRRPQRHQAEHHDHG